MSIYDVAVIGLGAMGSATLHEAASRGARVVGFEQFEPGHERGSSHGESRAIRLAYSEHPSYVPLARAAFAKWRALERATGETVLTANGVIEVGGPTSRMVAGTLEACRVHGLAHEVLDADALMRRFPAFTVPGDFVGVWQPEGGFVRPELGDRLHRDLAVAAGAEIRANTKVVAIEPATGTVRIVTETDTVEAGSVVVAAGAWAADLVPDLKAHLRIVRQVVCWYRPADRALFSPEAMPVFMIEGEDDLVYGFPDFAGTGVKCASHLGSGPIAHADAASQDAGPADEARTRRFLERFLPAAAGPLAAMRTCLYTMTPDEDFVIDRLPSDPRIVVASPCSGHGYKFAGVIGEICADLALDGATPHDIARFGIDRFRPSSGW